MAWAMQADSVWHVWGRGAADSSSDQLHPSVSSVSEWFERFKSRHNRISNNVVLCRKLRSDTYGRGWYFAVYNPLTSKELKSCFSA